jgi:hypothetical protein
MSSVHQLVPRSLRVARIVYFTDLTQVDARVIPLGALSEITHRNVHGLALTARGELDAKEIELINPLLRQRLAHPFNFLREEFQTAWDGAEPGEALAFLAERHGSSLSVLRPRPVGEAAWWQKLWSSPRIETKLVEAVDTEFASLMREYTDKEPEPERTVIEFGRAAA